MRRFVVAVTAWAMGLAWVLGGLTPVSASAQIPAVAAAGTVAVSTQGGFTSVAPFRLLDTRIAVPPAKVGVAVPAHGTVRLLVGGRGGVPGPGLTSAVVLNVTATAPTAGGFVTVYQDGDGKTLPTASNLNFVKGQIVPNLVVAPVGSNGKVALYNGSTGTVHLIVDVSGYYLAGVPTVAGAFGSLAPFRLLDTRIAVPPAKVGVAVPAHGTVRLLVGGRGSVPGPGLTSAVVLNVTATAPTAGGFV